MKKQLNEEFKRMQKLAGLITENEEGSGSSEIEDEEGSGFSEIEYEEGPGATPEEIEKIITFYSTEDGQFLWKYGGADDFKALSQGYIGDIKAEVYPSWTKLDFKKVLDMLPKY